MTEAEIKSAILKEAEKYNSKNSSRAKMLKLP